MRPLILFAALFASASPALAQTLPYDPLAVAVGVASGNPTGAQPNPPKPPKPPRASDSAGESHRPIKGGGYVIEEVTDDDRQVCAEEHNPKMEEQRHRFWMQDLEMIAATKAGDREAGEDRENDLRIYVEGEVEEHAQCLRRTAGTKWAAQMARKPASILHNSAVEIEHGPSRTEATEKLANALTEARRNLDALLADQPAKERWETPEIVAAQREVAAAERAYAQNLKESDPAGYKAFLERQARADGSLQSAQYVPDSGNKPSAPGPSNLPEYDGPAGAGPGPRPPLTGLPPTPAYSDPRSTQPNGMPGVVPPLSGPSSSSPPVASPPVLGPSKSSSRR